MIWLKKVIVTAFLVVQTLYCWWCFFESKELPYDENYGLLLQAICLSLAAWLGIRLFRAKWFGQFKLDNHVFAIWLVIGSPLIFILTFFFYSSVFGSLNT